MPLRQNYSDDMILYVRTERDPSTVLSAVQAEIRNIDPGLPVDDIRTGTKVIGQALWGAKIGVGMLSVFGLLALGLASVGLYGIMAYSVSQRRRESCLEERCRLGKERCGRAILAMGRAKSAKLQRLANGLAHPDDEVPCDEKPIRTGRADTSGLSGSLQPGTEP